jgi:hypothetical protein
MMTLFEYLTSYVSLQVFHKVSRNLLQSWSFYSQQILRELTLKSAPSFGSFNILRMLLDEYLFYIVQTRVTHPHKVIQHPDVIVRVQGSDSGASSVRPHNFLCYYDSQVFSPAALFS